MKIEPINVLRYLIGFQLMFFFFGPPMTLAAIFDNLAWLISIIPWGLFCAFLYGVARGSGWMEFKDSLLGKVYITAQDTIHLNLFKINAILMAVIIFFAFLHGHI